MEEKMIKVKWLKAHWNFAYSEGDIGYVTAKNAAILMSGGFVIVLPPAEAEEDNPLPADLPQRDQLFAAGFKTLEELKAAGQSIIDAGLSKTSVNKVTSYLTNHGF